MVFTFHLQANAQLAWNLKQIDVYPKISDTNAKVEFTFTNRGNLPILVKDVQTDCGCTTAQLDKKTYDPGEEGKITATFTFGDRLGLQQNHIVVRTDPPDDPYTQLTLRAFIPELMHVEPKYLRWTVNPEATPETKSFSIKIGTEASMKILGVSSTDDRIQPKLKIVEPGREYTIDVTPSDLREPAKANLRIEADYPSDKPRFFYFPVFINPGTLAGSK